MEIGNMGRLLFVVFLIVPIIEIGIFISVGQMIGIWPTLAGVVVTALIGSYIIRVQGISLFREIQQLMGAGALPARQIADGIMLAIAGALLLTPGYFTDFMGFLLLVPALRTLIYQALKSRISVQTGFSSTQTGPQGASAHRPYTTGNANRSSDPDVVDLDHEDWR